MQWISNSHIVIVGLGLMGGSYAKALTRLGYHVSAIDLDPDSVAYALGQGFIEKGAVLPNAEILGEADAAIFALYPTAFKEWIDENQHLLKTDALLTDVTGVKSCIVRDIQAMLRPDLEFIAAHPMAGREVSGVRNADDRIFLNANYIVTPTEKNTPETIEWCKALGRLLGCRKISVLSPEEHDRMIGFVSQLTHCIAVALMTCSDNTRLVDYTGDSFRDLTRIAKINEKMWSELFLLNQDELLGQMDRFIEELSDIRTMLYEHDREGLMEKMRLSTRRRGYFDV